MEALSAGLTGVETVFVLGGSGGVQAEVEVLMEERSVLSNGDEEEPLSNDTKGGRGEELFFFTAVT